jgi:hypothetical protein
MKMNKSVLVSVLAFIICASCTYAQYPWELPVLPVIGPLITTKIEVPQLHIPRSLWVGMRERPLNESAMPDHLRKLFARARRDGWEPRVMSNEDQLAFLQEYYPNTSTLWAFSMINSRVANAACDIWRYALLYAVGGLYLDDDSYIEASLNDVVGTKNDTLIVTAEKNVFRDNCYVRRYKLSEHRNMRKRYPQYESRWDKIAGNKMIASWGIFAAPYHPIIEQVLHNIVEVIRAEYLRTPLVFMMNTEPRWKIVMCATGPTMFTSTIWHYFVVAASNQSSGFTNPPPVRFVPIGYTKFVITSVKTALWKHILTIPWYLGHTP